MRHVVLVNETFVRKNLGGQDPLGRRLTIYMKDENVPTEIIGVVADNKHLGLDVAVEPMAYWPHPGTGLSGNDADGANARRCECGCAGGAQRHSLVSIHNSRSAKSARWRVCSRLRWRERDSVLRC